MSTVFVTGEATGVVNIPIDVEHKVILFGYMFRGDREKAPSGSPPAT